MQNLHITKMDSIFVHFCHFCLIHFLRVQVQVRPHFPLRKNPYYRNVLTLYYVRNIFLSIFTSREAARSREGVVLPGEEEEDVCLKKGVFCFLVHGSCIIWSFMVRLG